MAQRPPGYEDAIRIEDDPTDRSGAILWNENSNEWGYMTEAGQIIGDFDTQADAQQARNVYFQEIQH